VSVVLSDIDMPSMTGLELLREVRALDQDLPVVLVTGVPSLESAQRAIEYGVFRYLTKPVARDELRAVVAQAAKLYKLARAKRDALDYLGVAGPSDRVGLDVTFRRALESLWIAFQPIVSAAQHSVFGYEALLRSDAPALPGPQYVLDAAERLGALDELGRLIRRKASEPMHATDARTLLFVNLHPRDLMDPELLDASSALAPIASRVVLEITERSSLGGLTDVQGTVRALREAGFRIAIDDLGAGYAGLTSFALLEPEFVKIDMTLTRDIYRSTMKQKLVSSLVALCHDMGMVTVVEGVETREERDVLLGLGCDLLQGYLFAKPGRPFPEPTW
jgi:EAL domain-containing protein (putative c-di-GMP-specific phosphodiesterase class I)